MNEFAPSNKLIILSIFILFVGSALTAIGASLSVPGVVVLGASIVGASAVLVYRLLKAKRDREYAKEIVYSMKDERLMNIYVHAGNMTFWITFALVIAYVIYSGLKAPVLLFAPAILLMIYLVSSLYYMKKF